MKRAPKTRTTKLIIEKTLLRNSDPNIVEHEPGRQPAAAVAAPNTSHIRYEMSTERPPFSLNSFLPSGYMSKAEAFAKCLQDKLKSLGAADDGNEQNGSAAQTSSAYGPFSEEEIAENVFLQGPLSYKRRSIPEHSGQPFGNTRSKYFGQLVDKRGTSSDSEDSDDENEKAAKTTVHPRVAKLQRDDDLKIERLASVESISSWCSCEEGPADPDDDEEVIDALAQQIKGSPTIHNPRMRNLRRKCKEDRFKKEKTTQPVNQDADLFFDFDVECFSPVNVDDNNEFLYDFESSQLQLKDEEAPLWESSDTGQLKLIHPQNLLGEPKIVTPPPSPANGKLDTQFETEGMSQGEILLAPKSQQEHTVQMNDETGDENKESSSATLLDVHQTAVDTEPDEAIHQALEAEQTDREYVDHEYLHYYTSIYAKDSGICSCEETSSRTGDEDVAEVESCEIDTDDCLMSSAEVNKAEEELHRLQQAENSINIKLQEISTNDAIAPEQQPERTNESNETSESQYKECNIEDYVEKKREVTAPVMVMCEGVMVDEDYLPSPRMKLRRCSSLKTWKTPPGTPGRKKIVRFADALGLDLADVRTFLDEIPKIPNSAFEDLHYELPPVPPPPTTERTLIPLFKQPGTQMDFLQKVRQNNVSLESAVLTDVSLLAISGIVRVRNLSFHKTVHVRYSKDNWATFSDLQATFVPNSSDGFCDNFSFTLYGHTLNVGDRLEFAIRYECSAGQFWDSNLGQNYAFQCLPRNNMPLFPPLGSSPVDTPWNKFY